MSENCTLKLHGTLPEDIFSLTEWRRALAMCVFVFVSFIQVTDSNKQKQNVYYRKMRRIWL